MTEANTLFLHAALAMVIAACASYFVRVFNEERYVTMACRVNVARHYIAVLVALKIYLAWLVIYTVYSGRFYAQIPIVVVIVLVIIAILFLLTLQHGLPHYKASKKTKAASDSLKKLLNILTGKSPPVSSHPDDLFEYYFGALFGTSDQPVITKEKLVQIADLLEEAKRDEDARYDLDEIAAWLRPKRVATAAATELARLLAVLDGCLEAGDLSAEEKEKLERLKAEIERLRDALTRPPAAGGGSGN